MMTYLSVVLMMRIYSSCSRGRDEQIYYYCCGPHHNYSRDGFLRRRPSAFYMYMLAILLCVSMFVYSLLFCACCL